MSADGEIEVAVRAEGTEDAAEQLASSDGGGPGVAMGGGGGDGDGGGGLRQSLRGGIIGGLIGAGLGPLLDVLNPILDILKAFLAPVAVLLLRALSPVLRELIKLLPGWFEFVSNAGGYLQTAVEWIKRLPQAISAFIKDPIGSIQNWLMQAVRWLSERFKLDTLLSKLRTGLDRLLEQLGGLSTAIAEGIRQAFTPGFLRGGGRQTPPSPPVRRGSGDFGFNGASDAQSGSGIGSSNPIINFSGGLSTLIDRIESSADVDLQP